MYNAHPAERRRRMAVSLSRELRARYGRRSVPVRKGDTVRILSGSYAGREERVAKVNRRAYALTLDNITIKTAEAKLKTLPIRPSHLVLTRLNLADPWRRRVLRVPESEAPPPEEEPEVGTSTTTPTDGTAPSEPTDEGALPGPDREEADAEPVTEEEGEYEETGGEALEAEMGEEDEEPEAESADESEDEDAEEPPAKKTPARKKPAAGAKPRTKKSGAKK
jgi:large subunit ribosomal protein L24